MRHATRRRGFTLVELLVVIGIIALLIGVLLPVLGKARKQARMTTELAAARQLIQAYLMYTADNRGWLIPGHINGDLNLRGVDDRGNTLTLEPVKRWPWRLMPQIKFGLRGTILVGEQADALADRTVVGWSYGVSLAPSFGLNYYGLGGDYNASTATVYPTYASRKITGVTHSARRIVFASARGPGISGLSAGYFKIVPPTQPFEYSAAGWTLARYQVNDEPSAWGYVDPRWNGKAIIACLDGHAEPLPFEELRDMTRWCDPAARSGNTNWRP